MNENNEDKLRQIECFSEKSVQEPGTRKTFYAPPYGDITELNTNRLIMDSVGKKILREIAENAIDLLETSVAVYEANGDYAFGRFSSGWCRFMDGASRSLCNTDDNQEALNCGRWLCHENCWNDSAKPAMKSGHSTDIECVGGIRLYAETIYAGDQVIGVINIGYGDPPAHPEQLKMLAERFDVDPVKLREIAESYRPRPKVIVDLAKKQLRSWAKLIGNTVERIQAQKAKSENEALLSRTQQLAHVGSWRLDVPENRMAWSDETYRIFGLNPQEFDATYEAFLDGVHPDDRAKVDKAYSDSLGKGKDTYEIEHRIVRRHSGEIRHVYEKCVHERDTAGMIVRSIGMVQDITERKEAEAALRESEEWYRAIHDQSPIGIELYDQAGMLLDVNKACLNMFGVQNVQTLRGFDLFSDPNLKEEYKERLRNGKNVRYELIFDFEKVKEAGLYDTSRSGSIWLDVLITPTFWDSFRGYLVQVQDITTQKQAEEELRESHQRLEFALQGGELGMWDWNPQDGAVVYSDLWAQMLEYRPDEVEPTVDFFKQHIHPEDLAAVFDRLTGHVEGRLPVYESEHRLCTKSGNYFWVLDRGRIVERDKQGSPVRVTGIIADITERHRIQEKLRRVSDEFLRASRMAMVGGWSVDLKSGKHEWSEVTREIHEVGPDFIPDFQSAISFYKEGESRRKITDVVAQCMETGKSYDVDVQIITAKGRECWVRTIGSAEFQDGRCVRLYGAFQDITERKQAEEHLQKFKQIVSSTADGISLVDKDYRYVIVNKTYETFSGKKQEELIGHTVAEYLGENVFYEQIKSHFDKCLTGETVRYQDWFEYPNLVKRFLEVTYFPYMNARGAIEGVVGNTRDITEFKQAEAEREKLQAQLNQAQKMESVGRLAGGVAHDFNNMLGVILGHTELALLQADENHDLYSDLKEIQSAANRSADTTKQLLAFARKQTISPRQLDLNDTMESMLNMLRRLIGEDINLAWNPANGLWPVKMDPSQIDQILANLCVNARDAIAGVGKLIVETGMKTFDSEYCAVHAGFIPGDFVMLAVSDDGCGMDKEILDNLFEPFFTTKDIGKGTGLGLATVYGIVKQNNGFINVYSEPGGGTTFKVYLPRYFAADEIPAVLHPEKPLPTGNETILLVEDEPAILNITRMMLERKGYSVLSAATPAEAIDLAKTHVDKIHLLMTDVIMPKMNGWDLAKQLKVVYPEIKLFFMSGYTADIISHMGVLDEGVAFIQKPFSMKDLVENVRSVLDKGSGKLKGLLSNG